LARLEKLDYPVSYSGLSGFDSFQNRNREGARLEALMIKDVLMSREILEGDKKPMEKYSKPKAHVARIERFGFGNRNIQFLQIMWSPSRV
jgi:hypothetical protein